MYGLIFCQIQIPVWNRIAHEAAIIAYSVQGSIVYIPPTQLVIPVVQSRLLKSQAASGKFAGVDTPVPGVDRRSIRGHKGLFHLQDFSADLVSNFVRDLLARAIQITHGHGHRRKQSFGVLNRYVALRHIAHRNVPFRHITFGNALTAAGQIQ